MARRYDSRTTTFSPEGRLYQVEYAMAAINNAAAAVGIQTSEGVVIVAENKITNKLLAPAKSSEKIYKIDDHVSAVVAGLTADANILINDARVSAQRYRFAYQEAQPVELLVRRMCDIKQSYTQFGGLRPFGVSFLYAGWDRYHGYQLYQSDPSGNYGGWKASAIGNNSQSAQSTLKSDYRDDLTLDEAVKMACKVLVKAIDTTSPTAEKVEVMTLVRDEESGRIKHRVMPADEVNTVLKEITQETASAGDT